MLLRVVVMLAHCVVAVLAERRHGRSGDAHGAARRRRYRSVTLESGLVVLRHIGASGTRSQGAYGVNSVVYEATHGGERCALKGLIVAHGPFTARQGSQLSTAVRDEMRQPPHSPHLLRYHVQFDALVAGDVARDWPLDVETTPRGSLTRWLVMPLLPIGNLQAFIRTHALVDEAELLNMLLHIYIEGGGSAAVVQHDLLHRDLKLNNILVREDPRGGRLQLLLADFGTMAPMAAQQHGCTPGNPMKVAPELRTLQDLGPAAAAAIDLRTAEVWPVGTLAFDLVGASGPYAREDNTLLPDGESSSTETRGLVRSILSWRSADRPSAVRAAAWVTTRLLLAELETDVRHRRAAVEAERGARRVAARQAAEVQRRQREETRRRHQQVEQALAAAAAAVADVPREAERAARQVAAEVQDQQRELAVQGQRQPHQQGQRSCRWWTACSLVVLVLVVAILGVGAKQLHCTMRPADRVHYSWISAHPQPPATPPRATLALRSLTVIPGTLTPSFAPATTHYMVTENLTDLHIFAVANGTDSCTISTANSAGHRRLYGNSCNYTLQLTGKALNVLITVKGANRTRVYAIHVVTAQIITACKIMEAKPCGAAKAHGKQQCAICLQARGHRGALMKAACHASDFATFCQSSHDW